ncbi:hypothetical protein HDR69_06900 [bacterium]|nr:hypothetical protein [bacterium]
MIKVGISGADTPMAGELLRLCLHHPDVEIVSVYAPDKAGHPVSSQHHGFIGEERILFTSNFDATALDVAFLIKPLYSATDWVKLMADRPQLKLVLFSDAAKDGLADACAPVYGLSELNRKPLVRGARTAVVPNPLASPILIALYPLAKHLLLSGDLNVEIIAPSDLIGDEVVVGARQELVDELPKIQTSFNGKVVMTCTPSESDRAIRIRILLPTSTGVEEIFKIYNSIYDDHNFTYVVHHPVSTAEVEGTNKVLISVTEKTGLGIMLDIVADPRMRGGAGEAIHLMNLLFNLHEKTGLELKTSAWRKN